MSESFGPIVRSDVLDALSAVLEGDRQVAYELLRKFPDETLDRLLEDGVGVLVHLMHNILDYRQALGVEL